MLNPLTIPTAQELERIRHQPPIHSCDHQDIERYLRELHQTYPSSHLLVSVPADLIETSCQDGTRHLIHGHLVILEHPTCPDPTQRLQIDLLGGDIAREQRYIPSLDAVLHWTESGWVACPGIPGRWNACYLPADCMSTVGAQLFARLHSGEQLPFPRPLTPDERQQHLADARRHRLARLRATTAAHDPSFPFSN